MATIYTFNYSDTLKASFTVQPYTSNGPISPSDPSLILQATGANTTLKLYGKGMQEYGEGIEQNLIYMLENFSNGTRPVASSEGQLWYKNTDTGSPISGPELFIRNNAADDTTGWDAVILATGSSPMTGELTLSGDPANALSAVPKQYADNLLGSHATDDTIHLSVEQNTFLDGLTLPTLTPLEVDQLIGINTSVSVQAQLDTKINRSGDVMDASANLTFAGGEILGLPNIPSVDGAAASKFYVDNQLGGGAGGDGVLVAVDWITLIGTPVNVSQNALLFTINQLGVPSATISIEGISRIGHIHPSQEISYDNTLNAAYPTNVQEAIDYIETNKADLTGANFTGQISTTSTLLVSGSASFGGTVTAADPSVSSDLATKNYVDNLIGGGTTTSSTISRNYDILSADLISPTVYETSGHSAGDNKLSITINGLTQYNGSLGFQKIKYDSIIGQISTFSDTGLDETIDHDFAISVDSSAPTTITIVAGTPISTHGDLRNVINNLLSLSTISAFFVLNGEFTITESFKSFSTGTSSNVNITDPVAGNTFLFATDPAPLTIVSATFLSDLIIPDDIRIAGDVTATFIPGKTFTIKGSNDATYGTYDAGYSVHDNNSVFDGTNTIIPIASVNDSSVLISLFPFYSPPATVPAPSAFGAVSLTPIVGFEQILPGIAGFVGDYIETDISGAEAGFGQDTDYVVFNVDILAASKIETILIS